MAVTETAWAAASQLTPAEAQKAMLALHATVALAHPAPVAPPGVVGPSVMAKKRASGGRKQ